MCDLIGGYIGRPRALVQAQRLTCIGIGGLLRDIISIKENEMDKEVETGGFMRI